MFQLNEGLSSKHEQEWEYLMVKETTGPCYGLFPVECFYILL